MFPIKSINLESIEIERILAGPVLAYGICLSYNDLRSRVFYSNNDIFQGNILNGGNSNIQNFESVLKELLCNLMLGSFSSWDQYSLKNHLPW